MNPLSPGDESCTTRVGVVAGLLQLVVTSNGIHIMLVMISIGVIVVMVIGRDGSRLTNFNLCQDIQKGSPFSINLTYLMRF